MHSTIVNEQTSIIEANWDLYKSQIIFIILDNLVLYNKVGYVITTLSSTSIFKSYTEILTAEGYERRELDNANTIRITLQQKKVGSNPPTMLHKYS